MFDYVIAGAGSAGCTLAARLSEDGDASVLLLEAGGADTSMYIHMPVGFYKMTTGPLTWGYRTAPLAQGNGREMVYPQGRVLGGSSSINAMVYTRGNPSDYDAWAEQAGCRGWAYRDVLPYFRRAEGNDRLSNEHHGVDGPLGVSDLISPHPLTKAFVRAAQEAGIPYNPDFNGPVQQGCGIYQTTIRGGRRCSAAVGYLRPARDRRNLTVRVGTHVARVLVEGGRAVGIEYIDATSGRTQQVRANREVLVAAGAIGSPKLLMLSGIGPADALRKLGIAVVHDLPGVGQNLQDHVDVYSIHELNGPYSYDRHTRLHRKLWSGLQYYFFRSGPVTSNLAEGGGFWFADRDQTAPDIQFHFLPGAGLEAGVPPLHGYGCTINSCHLRPRSRGHVRLASADPLAPPIIDPNFWADPYDLQCSIEGFKWEREIAASPSLGRFIRREHLPGKDCRTDADIAEYGRRFAKTDYHPVGTCKMGVDAMAVVDPELKLRGIAGLRVADSSIMPLLISSNTNAATIMIAEKASDLIRGRAPLAAAA